MNTENTFIKSFPSLIILGVVFLLDRLSKNYILNYFKTSDTEIVVNRYLNFDLIWNSGVAFGFFSFNDTLAYQLMTVLTFNIADIFITIGIICILFYEIFKKA